MPTFIRLNEGSFRIKVVGVTVSNRQEVTKSLKTNQSLTLKREPNNAFDSNALGVFIGSRQVGYIPKELSAIISPRIDRGTTYNCCVHKVIGGGIGHHYGVVVDVAPEKSFVHSQRQDFDDDYGSGDFFKGMDEDERQGWDDMFDYVNDH